jgi:iron complex transport system ATP-binding protein
MLSPPATPFIDLRHVYVMRGLRTVLHDLTLRIDVGEHLAILGPNGCGKSTLVKTLTRECYPLARPETEVRLFGRDTWNIFELRSHLGIVSNDFVTTRPTSGYDVVLSGFFASVGIFPHQQVTSEMEGKAHEALARLEATHLSDRTYGEMSSGEARRILIARALVHAPQALLFDEPSTSLDLFAQHELREIMRKLAASGLALLLITHHLSDIVPEIERVVMIKAGRIVGDGPRAELLTKSAIERLFNVSVEISERNGYIHAW